MKRNHSNVTNAENDSAVLKGFNLTFSPICVSYISKLIEIYLCFFSGWWPKKEQIWMQNLRKETERPRATDIAHGNTFGLVFNRYNNWITHSLVATSPKNIIFEHKSIVSDENDPEQAERKRPFKCEQCGMRFRNEQNLRNHRKNVHSELLILHC